MRLLLLLLLPWQVSAWPLPQPLETTHLLGKGLPSGAPPVALTDELYALGWSRSNVFAYLERRTVGDGRLTRVRVQDLVEDRILWEREWPDWGDEGGKEAWWAAREAELQPVFASYSLQPTSWQLGVFPLILDNEFYTLALRTFPGPEKDWLERWQVIVHSTGRGLKTVGEESGYWRWVSLLGFLPSPFENRVALVLLVQPAGWLGRNQPLRFLVTGLSLKAGFPTP